MNEKSLVLLVFSTGVQMGFEISKATAPYYVMGHKAFQSYVALFIDGVCQHRGVFGQDQTDEMERMLQA